MESKHRTYRRTDGTLGVGFVLKFADCSQACIAWPDTVPERIYVHQLEQAGIEDVTDQMAQAAVTIETRKLENHDDWPLNAPVMMQPCLAPDELAAGETKLMQILGDGPEGYLAAVGVTDGMHHYVKKTDLYPFGLGMASLFRFVDGEWQWEQSSSIASSSSTEVNQQLKVHASSGPGQSSSGSYDSEYSSSSFGSQSSSSVSAEFIESDGTAIPDPASGSYHAVEAPSPQELGEQTTTAIEQTTEVQEQTSGAEDGSEGSAIAPEGLTAEVAAETLAQLSSEELPLVDGKQALSEAESIRNYLAEHGTGVSNKSVIEALAKNGINIVSSQVTRARAELTKN